MGISLSSFRFLNCWFKTSPSVRSIAKYLKCKTARTFASLAKPTGVEKKGRIYIQYLCLWPGGHLELFNLHSMRKGLLSWGCKADSYFICCHWEGLSLKLTVPSCDFYMRQSKKHSRDTWSWHLHSLSSSFTRVPNSYPAFQLMQVSPTIHLLFTPLLWSHTPFIVNGNEIKIISPS